MPLTSVSVQPTIAPSFSTNFGPIQPNLQSINATFTVGTTAGLADLLYNATRTATTGGDSLDLNGGGLLQPDQSAFNAVDVALVAVVNRSTSSTITVGGGTNAVPNLSMVVKPGGTGLVYTTVDPAYSVTAGTGDILKVATDTGTATYDILIVGRSA